MVTCCVPSCNSTFKRNGELSFHQFPKDEKTRNAWILVIASQGNEPWVKWEPTPRAMVCGKHFAPECFSVSTTRRILLPRSIPSVFGDSCRKRKQPRKKNNKKKRKHEDNDNETVQECDSASVIQQECDSTSARPSSRDVAVQVNSIPLKPSKKKTIIIKIGLIKRQRKTITKLKAYISALKEALKANGSNV